VVEEMDLYLGPERQRVDEALAAWGQNAAERVIRAWQVVKWAERQYFGSKSFFNLLDLLPSTAVKHTLFPALAGMTRRGNLDEDGERFPYLIGQADLAPLASKRFFRSSQTELNETRKASRPLPIGLSLMISDRA
jgi:hypothetical protein